MRNIKELIPVDGNSNLAKDQHGVVHNINKQEVHAARERKRIRREQEIEKAKEEQRLSNLETQMTDIKSMLATILEKL